MSNGSGSSVDSYLPTTIGACLDRGGAGALQRDATSGEAVADRVDRTRQDEGCEPDHRRRSADQEHVERNQALDGVRFVAVAAVLAFHFRVPGAHAGFLGVDLFFVLSGFLITWILLKQVESGRVRLVDFWTRRVRRLAPAIVLALAAMIAWGALEASMTSRDALRADITATLAYVANWHFIASSNYFQATGDESPLLHMWTLAVEEQFYVLWPVALFLIALLVPPRARLTAVAAVAVSGVLVSAWRLHSLWVGSETPDRAYMGTDSRMFGPMVGALVAVALMRAPRLAASRWPNTALMVAGSAVLVWADVRAGVGERTERDVPAWRRAALRPGLGGGHLGPVDAGVASLRDARARSHRIPRPYLVRHLHLALAAHRLGGKGLDRRERRFDCASHHRSDDGDRRGCLALLPRRGEADSVRHYRHASQ